MPWFWDPVAMSSQIPLSHPDPGASAFEEQGFAEAVAARIEAPQKGINQISL